MTALSTRRTLIFAGLSVVTGTTGLLTRSWAQAPATPSGVASKLAPGPSGIEFLDYDPPRRWAAGARVGDIAYLAGVTPRHPATGQGVDGTIEQQTELVCQNIQAALTAFGTDFAHVFKVTVYLTNMDDLIPVGRVRARFHPRPIPSSTVAVARLSEPYFKVEIDAMALIPKRG